MNPGGFIDLKNSTNLAKWRWRWHKQGGSGQWHARPLQDLRDDEGLRRWRVIECKRRHIKAPRAKVINLTHERCERIRRKLRGRR